MLGCLHIQDKHVMRTFCSLMVSHGKFNFFSTISPSVTYSPIYIDVIPALLDPDSMVTLGHTKYGIPAIKRGTHIGNGFLGRGGGVVNNITK